MTIQEMKIAIMLATNIVAFYENDTYINMNGRKHFDILIRLNDHNHCSLGASSYISFEQAYRNIYKRLYK